MCTTQFTIHRADDAVHAPNGVQQMKKLNVKYVEMERKKTERPTKLGRTTETEKKMRVAMHDRTARGKNKTRNAEMDIGHGVRCIFFVCVFCYRKMKYIRTCVFVLINLHRSTRHSVGSFPRDTNANDRVHAACDCVFVGRPLIFVRTKSHPNIKHFVQLRFDSDTTSLHVNQPCHNRCPTIEINI